MQTYDTNYKISHADLAYGRKLGEGGFGEVFEGEWQHSQVAIKKLLMQKLSPEASQELETEAKMMAELRHDNIIGFRGFCFESPNYALVMEYMPRGSLYDLLHSSQDIDWANRVQISIGAGAGLVYLHNKNILHRDIKSHNVLLHEKEGTLHAKLSDFGLSKLKTDSLASSKSHKGFAGTLQYGAPELHDDESHQKASDIYSYAVMLWEIAARQVPFSNAKTSAALMRQAIMGHQEAIPEGAPQLFKETIELGRRVVPSERPTAEQMVSSLKFLMQSLQKAEPAQSKQPSSQPNPNPHPQPMPGLQGNYASGSVNQPKQPAPKQPKAPHSFQGNLVSGPVSHPPGKKVPASPQLMPGLQGNYISGAVNQPMQPVPKQAPVANSFQGNLASNMPSLPNRPEQPNPQLHPAANFSGIANNLQTAPAPSPKPPTEAELKLAQQQAEIESLKNSMDALLKMKEREERKKKHDEEKKEQKKQERREKQHAEAEQLKNLSSNERVNAKAASLAAKVTPAAVKELLDHTVRGDLDNVKRCLQNNSTLAYAQGDITDPAGRAFKKITAFQYAVWALDKEMWQLLLTVLLHADAYDQLHALEHERQDIIRVHGAHFSFDPLLNAYKRYLDNCMAWYNAKNWGAMENCWCKGIGGAQRMVPAWFIYLFSEHGNDKAWPTGQVEKPFARIGRTPITEWAAEDRLGRKLAWCRASDWQQTHDVYQYPNPERPKEVASYADAELLAKLKLARVRELAELTDQLSQAAVKPSSSLRFGQP